MKAVKRKSSLLINIKEKSECYNLVGIKIDNKHVRKDLCKRASYNLIHALAIELHRTWIFQKNKSFLMLFSNPSLATVLLHGCVIHAD